MNEGSEYVCRKQLDAPEYPSPVYVIRNEEENLPMARCVMNHHGYFEISFSQAAWPYEIEEIITSLHSDVFFNEHGWTIVK